MTENEIITQVRNLLVGHITKVIPQEEGWRKEHSQKFLDIYDEAYPSVEKVIFNNPEMYFKELAKR